MTDCLDFKMFRSSGATQSQVTEFQPFPEQLLTEYFMFGYQFEPSTWLADVNHYRKDFYNPINDLLNPLNVGPDEMLQKMSQQFIQEELLKEKYRHLKDKQRILKFVPENLRNVYGYLFDSGALLNASNERIDAMIANMIQGGQLSEGEANDLTRLISRRDLFNQMMSQSQSEDSNSELEGTLRSLSDTFISRGATPAVARSFALRGVSDALDKDGYSGGRGIFNRALDFAEQYAEGMADASQNVGMGPRQQQFGAEVEQMERETGILQSGSYGFGTRSSMPLGVGDVFGGDMTTSGVRSSAFAVARPLARRAPLETESPIFSEEPKVTETGFSTYRQFARASPMSPERMPLPPSPGPDPKVVGKKAFPGSTPRVRRGELFVASETAFDTPEQAERERGRMERLRAERLEKLREIQARVKREEAEKKKKGKSPEERKRRPRD